MVTEVLLAAAADAASAVAACAAAAAAVTSAAAAAPTAAAAAASAVHILCGTCANLCGMPRNMIRYIFKTYNVWYIRLHGIMWTK